MINDVEGRTKILVEMKTVMDSTDNSPSSSSSSSQETALADCEGTQPYLFEPYDSEASSGTDSTDESKEGQFERLQNTDW